MARYTRDNTLALRIVIIMAVVFYIAIIIADHIY